MFSETNMYSKVVELSNITQTCKVRIDLFLIPLFSVPAPSPCVEWGNVGHEMLDAAEALLLTAVLRLVSVTHCGFCNLF